LADNSPAFQGWEICVKIPKVPSGTAESFFRPIRDFCEFEPFDPALKRWAIFKSAPGCSNRTTILFAPQICATNSACTRQGGCYDCATIHPPRPAGFPFLTGSEHFYFVKVFSGTANEPLARAICKSISLELGKIIITPFPDGETFVKIEENVRGEDIFIIQPTSPPTNHNLMELFIIIDALRRASATRITAVMPFYGYARQDRKDQPRGQAGGEPAGGRRREPDSGDGFARAADSGLFRHPGGSSLRRAGDV
jgi:hypothetical protein